MVSPELLRQFKLFAGADVDVLRSLAMLSSEMTVHAGEWLFHEGDDADALYVISEGKITLKLAMGRNGKGFADLDTLVRGDLVGWSAVSDPYIYRLGALAEKDTHLIQLDAGKLREYLAANNAYGYVLMGHIAKAIGSRLNALRIQFASVTQV